MRLWLLALLLLLTGVTSTWRCMSCVARSLVHVAHSAVLPSLNPCRS